MQFQLWSLRLVKAAMMSPSLGWRLFAALGALMAGAATASSAASEPFLIQLNSRSWVIGNDIWNVTQGPVQATKLWFGGKDCVGNASGHYVSYSKVADARRAALGPPLPCWRLVN